jgi:uncharacterized protein YndB with AHSA1/START domain
MSTNRIVKQARLKSTQSRVWKALTEANQFGSWFGMKLEGRFVAGQKISGVMTPTQVDPDVAKMQKPYDGMPVDLWIERVEPETFFSFHWDAYPPEENEPKEVPKNLVTFALETQGDFVLLTVTESGFDQLPANKKLEALKSNEGGWEKQMELIAKYLNLHAN